MSFQGGGLQAVAAMTIINGSRGGSGGGGGERVLIKSVFYSFLVIIILAATMLVFLIYQTWVVNPRRYQSWLKKENLTNYLIIARDGTQYRAHGPIDYVFRSTRISFKTTDGDQVELSNDWKIIKTKEPTPRELE